MLEKKSWENEVMDLVDKNKEVVSGEMMSKKISYLLWMYGVNHRLCYGWVRDTKCKYKIGWWWIEMSDGMMIDFCYRSLNGGDVELPFGIFDRFYFIGRVMYHRIESWDACWFNEKGSDNCIRDLYFFE